jgi:hypothetical protein
MPFIRKSTSISIEKNFTNDCIEKRKILLKTRFLINPICEQAIAKVRQKIENKFFSNGFPDYLKEEWFEVKLISSLIIFT